MGALAQFPVLWTPEDDLRLKNAVEGGASLESLAKGAVQFSQRFTLQEIKERWVSILYDPVVSAEVSARLMEMVHNSSNHSHKSLRPGGLKENKCNAKKTKTESIRDHYYAARKRIRYENLRSMEMELAGGHVYASDHNNAMEPLFNTMLGEQTLNQFNNQQSDAGLKDHCFPQAQIDGVATCTGVTVRPFDAPHEQFNPETSLAEQRSMPEGNPEIFGEASLPVDCLQAEKLGIHEDANMCHANGVNNLFDEFDGLLPYSSVSLDSLDFPSPLPEMSLWDINLDIPVPMMPVNDNPASQSHNARDVLALQEDGQALDAFLPDTDAGPANSLNRGDGTTNSGSDEYLAEIYDLLDDELLVMDTDDKPPNDKPLYEDLKSLLLTSPIVADGDQATIKASIPSDLTQSTTNIANLVVSCVPGASLAVESQPFPRSDFQMSKFSISPQTPSQNDFAACIFNTEDPHVPNNDDITLPYISSSVKDLLERRNHCGAASNLYRRDHENLGKREFCSKAQIGQFAPEKSFNHTSVDCKAPNNLPEAGTHTSLRSTSLLPDFTKKGHSELIISQGLDHCMNTVACPLETNGLCNKSDNLLGETLDDQALNQKVDFYDPSTRESRFENHVYESEDEIPYYSDVEDMVLEMDLDPVERDIELEEKVTKYQSSDAKKTVIRLEQAAHSFMQRAIARRGALAVIYGHNSKHYIKKSEVLLGRGTDECQVDIDLGAEGRAHKVSRRQAVIKLEADGNFYIKNIGKRSIYKNNLEIATGKTTRLHSGSLIEIQRLTVIFEDSPICVRRHLRNLQKPVKQIKCLPETS